MKFCLEKFQSKISAVDVDKTINTSLQMKNLPIDKNNVTSMNSLNRISNLSNNQERRKLSNIGQNIVYGNDK